MLRRTVLAAALAAAALSAAPAAQAAPPYCVTVTAGPTTITEHCVIGTGCVVYGTVLPSSPAGFTYCVQWPIT